MNSLNFPLKRHQFGPILLIIVVSLVLALFKEPHINIGDYSREHIVQWQLWRVFTAHLFHTNANHLLLNLAGLVLLWALHGDYYSFGRIGLTYIVCAAAVVIGIHSYTPELSRYVGLSGVLHGLFVWGACNDIYRRYRTGYLLLIGLAVKIGVEQLQGPDVNLGQWINATVAIDAHLYGALGGVIAFFATRAIYRYKDQRVT